MSKGSRPTELRLTEPPSKLYPGSDGRLYVDLRIGAITHTRQVLGISAGVYDGPCPRGLAPHYRDGDTTNAHPTNLSYRLNEAWKGGTAEILHLNGDIQDNRLVNLAYISDVDR